MAQQERCFYEAILLSILALGRGVTIDLAGTFTATMKNIKGF
jgi:hypothetical protein